MREEVTYQFEDLNGEVTHYAQECAGNYLFQGVVPVMTPGILEKFGSRDASVLMKHCLEIVDKTYDNPDYLQVFKFRNTKLYCIAEFRKGDKAEDYEGVPFLYVTLLLPDEY